MASKPRRRRSPHGRVCAPSSRPRRDVVVGGAIAGPPVGTGSAPCRAAPQSQALDRLAAGRVRAIVVDDGARRALRGPPLAAPCGSAGVEGEFDRRRAVEIVADDGERSPRASCVSAAALRDVAGATPGLPAGVPPRSSTVTTSSCCPDPPPCPGGGRGCGRRFGAREALPGAPLRSSVHTPGSLDGGSRTGGAGLLRGLRRPSGRGGKVGRVAEAAAPRDARR